MKVLLKGLSAGFLQCPYGRYSKGIAYESSRKTGVVQGYCERLFNGKQNSLINIFLIFSEMNYFRKFSSYYICGYNFLIFILLI